ncbi:hypothetical protein [Paenibacillus sp. PAMC 26794]|uniref:AAA family ATPase n=1 Tax=Paenibacillus sp. PAMC 26794 TaxID=1257080 RepID=UPI0002F6CA20|nr:hypothetical protein [Paenibacillus sp. PAMC 26794]
MIPYKMWFAGIRDYDNTVMDLSGRQEHILITGPNGAGKSTITYCMGAVLYSSKVELEGLKSRNLLPDHTWNAQIRLLFRNEGSMKIDAPEWIEFAIYISQEPGSGQPVKREYVVYSGDRPGEWLHETRYSSGDRQYNFTAYKRDLEYKYKIDPDLFYLIWYQQEVNQFAVMHSEERFRIFAAMHGIDAVQRNWEESVEQLQETRQTLLQAETNVSNKKQWLHIQKSSLDRYEDNRKRLLEGGELYASSLLQLEDYYKREEKELKDQLEQLEWDREHSEDQLAHIRLQTTEILLRQSGSEQQMQALTVELQQRSIRHEELEAEQAQTVEVIQRLESDLAAIQQEQLRITRTENEVQQQLDQVVKQLEKLGLEHEQLQNKLSTADDRVTRHIKAIALLETEAEQDRKAEQEHVDYLQRYAGSYAVQEEMTALEEQLNVNKDLKRDLLHQRQEFLDESDRLASNRDWSSRQRQSLSYFDKRGVQAYSLRDLIEMDEGAPLQSEERLEPIKYAIFFDGRYASVPNDLYHVPLKSVIPDKSVMKIPSLHLRVKPDLTEEVLPFAMKSLWWVEQFFREVEPRITEGVLLDSMGIRGPQEKRRYILSEQALVIRREELDKNITLLTEKVEHTGERITSLAGRLQELNSILPMMKRAEAFMTREHERNHRRDKLMEENSLLVAEQQSIREMKKLESGIIKQLVQLEEEIRVLQLEADFYVRLGNLKGKYEQLNVSQRRLADLKAQIGDIQDQMKEYEDQQDAISTNLRRLKREDNDTQAQLESETNKLNWINKQMENRRESFVTAEAEHVNIILEIEDFKGVSSLLMEQVLEELQISQMDEDQGTGQSSREVPSLSRVRMGYENGKTKYNHARNEANIDPAAPENYRVVKEEFERLQDEYKRTKLLFEQDEERTIQLKDQLETTIQMRVLEIQQQFRSYMALFQFEGEINWEQYADKKGRTHFHLYIRARKEGHRGTMEDVSLKARGGRVGKGVSGGEESLSSLLFALALLRNLQTSPGFIVLDEFDSALDEQRKLKVFDLYHRELARKLIILTPKSHENTYLNRFKKAYVVHHNPILTRSRVAGIHVKKQEELSLDRS